MVDRGRDAAAADTSRRAVTAKAPSSRVTVERRSHQQRLDRRQFDRRARKRKCPERGDLVRRRRAGLCQRAIGKPADIAVAFKLAPGPAFAVAVVDGRRVRLSAPASSACASADGSLAQRRDARRRSRTLSPVDKARGLDLAFEIFRGEVGPRRRQARVIHSVRPAICRSRARPGIRRLRAAPAWPTASSRRCRHAASFSRARRSAAGTARR